MMKLNKKPDTGPKPEKPKKQEFRPNSIAQAQFIASTADECLYAGAAGSGKTFALLMAAALQDNNYLNPTFAGIIFRNTFQEVEKVLWVEANKMYPLIGGVYNKTAKVWNFKSGARIYFGYLDGTNDVSQYLGMEIQFLGFDEVQLQQEENYKFLWTRARSSTGITKRIRSTANPWAEWVYKRFFWWLDHTFCLCEADKRAEALGITDDASIAKMAESICVDKTHLKSGTIIRIGDFTRQAILGRLKDNTTLMENDPNYEKILLSQDNLFKERYFYNNWRAQPSPGTYFKRSYFKFPAVPPSGLQMIRSWDIAATSGAGDYTVGVLMGILNGHYYILDIIRGRMSPDEVYNTILNTAILDGKKVMISLAKEPGAAGKFVQGDFSKLLNGFNFQFRSESGDKETKATPFARQVQAGNVSIIQPTNGQWSVKDFIDELEAFPEGRHDDQVDAVAGAYNTSIGQIIIPYRRFASAILRKF